MRQFFFWMMAWVAAAALFAGAGAARGAPNATAQFEDLGVPVRLAQVRGTLVGPGAAGQGESIYVSLSQDGPVQLLRIDPQSGASAEFMAPAQADINPKALLLGPDRRIYLSTAGNGQILRLDPAQPQMGLRLLGSPAASETYVWALTTGSDGMIYGCTYPHAKLIRIDPKSDRMEDLGRMDPQEQYAQYLAAGKDNHIYISVGYVRQDLVAYDIATGEHHGLFPGDWRTAGCSPVENGANGLVYVVRTDENSARQAQGFYRVDGEKLTAVSGFPVRGTSLADGRRVQNVTMGNGGHSFLELVDPKSKASKRIEFTHEASGSALFLVGQGPHGEIYGSSVQPFALFRQEGGGSKFLGEMGGAECYSMLAYKEWLYLCAYPYGVMNLYDPGNGAWSPGKEAASNPRDFGRLGAGHLRPRAMVAGPQGMIYVGSLPLYGQLGGAMAVWDPGKNEVAANYPDLVHDQGITSLAYDPGSGLVFGGTSIAGGGGATATQKEARFFAFDPGSGKKQWEMALIPGAADYQAMAAAGGRVFVSAGKSWCAFDPKRRAVVQQGSLPGVQIDTALGAFGGVLYGLTTTSVYTIDPRTLRLAVVGNSPVPIEHGFAACPDGVYFTSGAHLAIEICPIMATIQAQTKKIKSIRERSRRSPTWNQAMRVPLLEILEPRMLLSGATASIRGSSGDDVFNLTITRSAYVVSVNGSVQSVSFADAPALVLDGGGGADSLTITGGPGPETAILTPTGGSLTGAGFSATFLNFPVKWFNGGPGDIAWLYDSGLGDVFVGRPTWGQLSGSGFLSAAANCDRVNAISSARGADTAYLYDSSGNDWFGSTPAYAYLKGTSYFNYAAGFAQVYAYATAGGSDTAALYDSPGDDRFGSTPGYAYMKGAGFYDYASGFGMVYAYATAGGSDTAAMYGSGGGDRFGSAPGYGYLQGGGFYDYAGGFDYVYAYESGGSNLAVFYDSPGDDRFGSTGTYGYLQGTSFYDYAGGFATVYGYATSGGNDIAVLYDSPGDDQLVVAPGSAYVQGPGFYSYALNFATVYGYSVNGGSDSAALYDSPGDDIFASTPTAAYITGAGYYGYAGGFARVYGYSIAGGADRASLSGGAGGDVAVAGLTWDSLAGNGFYSYVEGFGKTTESGQGGADVAVIDDPLNVSRDSTAAGVMTVSIAGFSTMLSDFGQVEAYTPAGLVDAGLGATVVTGSGASPGDFSGIFDGNSADNALATSLPLTFVIALGREADISRLDLVWGSETDYASAYKIEIVDADQSAAYQTIADVSGKAGQVQIIDLSAQSGGGVRAAFLRITVTAASLGDAVTLRQIRVLATPPSAVQAILLDPVNRSTIIMSGSDPDNPLSIFGVPITQAMQLVGEYILQGMGALSDHQKIVAFMDFLNEARIGDPSDGTPEAALLENIGACGNWTDILVALAATQGMQARIIDLFNYPFDPATGTFNGHTDAEIFINGEWELYDPTYGVYYTSDPGNDVDPHVLSFDDLKAGGGFDADVMRVVDNPVRLAQGGAAAEEFAGPEIFIAANPSGVIGPDKPMVFPEALDLVSNPTIAGEQLSVDQGSWILGSAYVNVSQLFSLSGLTVGETYVFTAKYSGADGGVDPQFQAQSQMTGGTILHGGSYTFQTGAGAGNGPWSITFTAGTASVQLLLTHDYVQPFYLEASSYTLGAAAGTD